MVANPGPGKAVLQIDFSENASIIQQDEIQTAHWSHEQVTIFTAVVWCNDRKWSYAIVSDYLEHDKLAAAKFIDTIVDDVKIRDETVTKLEIFSDGAAQHFKSRFMMAYLTSLKERKAIDAAWNFFATSHGKGAVDGIGGNIKRQVRGEIMARRAIINTPKQFADTAQKTSKSTMVIYTAKEEISNDEHIFKDMWERPKLDSIRSMHRFKALEYGLISAKIFSRHEISVEHSLYGQEARRDVPDELMAETEAEGEEEQEEVVEEMVEEAETREYLLGELVAVAYDIDGMHIGELIKKGPNKEYDVKFMVRQGKTFKWPSRDDMHATHQNFILGVQPVLRPCSANLRSFMVENWDEVMSAFDAYAAKFFK
jgi:hypothetical protein